MSAVIRSASCEDIDRIADFLELAYRQTYWSILRESARNSHPPGIPLRNWPLVLEGVSGEIAVIAEDADQVIGYARSLPSAPEVGDVGPARHRELHLLYVHESHHGTGLARRLFDSVIGPDESVELWVVDSNARAVAFYRKLGLTLGRDRRPLGGVVPVADGITVVRMIR